MFSGSDLLTARALFPHAPSYNLVADFPTGDPRCFLDAACAARANESASAFFKHWANLRFARQSTNLMRRAFATSGQLPALLLSLRLMSQPILHASLSPGPAALLASDLEATTLTTPASPTTSASSRAMDLTATGPIALASRGRNSRGGVGAFGRRGHCLLRWKFSKTCHSNCKS